MKNRVNRTPKNIKVLREQSGLSQRDLAKFLSVKESLIAEIEEDKHTVTSDIIDNLSALFGVSPETLQKETDVENKVTFKLNTSKLNTAELKAISAVNKIALNLQFMTQLEKENPS
ncbi:MAG: helix-turn-helix transcriptional regulator [Sphaerochaetaceae bacterium]|jgi:transcriptional regulator with XRE-family HTH domain